MTKKPEMTDSIPLPPEDANVTTTACAYCIVGCGYKVYTWPVGKQGESGKNQNALKESFPTDVQGPWISPNQHNIVKLNGHDHYVAVVPDFDATVVNPGGNHSIRGGVLAQKCYNPKSQTKDRLLSPQLRVNGKLTRVSWDFALDVMATVSKYVLDKYGESAWAMKTYSYEFFENTYAITKLAFEAIQTPAYAVHDKPSMGNDTAGVDDAGIKTFSASYKDWSEAEVLFISGTDPYETKTVLFTEWMMNQNNKMIMILPRRSTGVAYAEKNGGLFLQINPGTDTLLHLALIRIILENGWEDQAFIKEWIADEWEIDSGFGRGTRNTPWQWRTTWGNIGALGFEEYKNWILNNIHSDLDYASRMTGIPKEKIFQAAEMISGAGKTRPKTSFGFEKGCYWSNNYTNTTSFAALALLCGAGNRPGRVVSRMGGHQRGWISAASYPRTKSPEKLPGRRRLELDLDRWVTAGNVKFAWIIGTTWLGAMTASQELEKTLRSQTVENPHQLTSLNRDDVINTFINRIDSGGMVLADSDIYPVEPLGQELADILLPAAQWGEHDGTRCNGERRLRLYSKFYDAPGEAKPDWWAISRFAQKMGFKGFDWEDANQVFEEAARFSRGNILDYYPLVWKAKRNGERGHDALGKLGTTGIQTPIRLVDDELVGTRRLHDPELNLGSPNGPNVHSKWLTHFNTHSGKALLIKSPWEIFEDFYQRVKPDPSKGEFWFTVGRINETWQSGFDTLRSKYLAQRWPDSFVEIHPDDARKLEIENGDYVRLYSNDILVQKSGFQHVKSNSFSFTQLMKDGHIQVGHGETKAVAIVTSAVLPGLLFGMFLYGKRMANSLVHRVPDPITHSYRYKLGKAQIEKLGESPFKNDFQKMSFKPRDYAGQ